MKSAPKISHLPPRLVLSGLAAAVLLVSTVLVGMYLGMQTRERFKNVDSNWQKYISQAATRGELLSQIRGQLGYGGVIHNFKNFVLRKDGQTLERLNLQLKKFHKTISQYKNTNASAFELVQLATIEKTIKIYEAKIPVAIEAAKKNWPPAKTDILVRVDDANAIKAMLALDRYLKNKRIETTRSISEAVKEGNNLVKTGFFFVGLLAIISLILYGMFFRLLRELQLSITRLSSELAERKTAELVAKKFQRAVDQSPATIIITDTAQKIEYVNEKFSELTGYSPVEVLGKTPKFLQSGDISANAYADLSKQLRNNKRWQGTFRNLKKDGSSYWADSVILPLRDDTGTITHFIGLGEDVTEHKKARDHIQRAQKMEAVGLLASGVAHDFNNVLTTILGNVHLAKLDAPQDGEFSEELDQIEIAAKRARHLVGQILAFARRQPGKKEPLLIYDLISEVIRLIRASTQPNIALKYEVDDEKLAVHADPTRLHQVLMNLCSNAAEAIGTKGGTITVTAKRQQSKNGDPNTVLLSICDDGPGIPADILADIFTPFFTTKKTGKGTGLGLSVVASLVDEMGGDVTVQSNLGQGCHFKITLPEATGNPTAKQGRTKPVTGSGRVMLIDDEPEVLAICAKILSRANYQIETFSEPQKALDAFAKAPEKFDLVITDYVMPEMSGQDVCRAIREIRNDCPIIIYSAYQPEKLQLQRLEPIAFIGKPFEPEVLADSVYEMINKNSH